MSNNTNGIGLIYKSNPVISFYSIIDEDMSLIKYVISEFRNNEVFDLDRISKEKYLEILSSIYLRKYKNPLYYLARDEKYYQFLDECYKEFLELKEKDILKYAVSSEMMNVLIQFKNSGDIVPHILYYNNIQKEFIESIPELKNIDLINSEDLFQINEYGTQAQMYTQYYFKYIEEVNPFVELHDKTFYFSSCGTNINDTEDDLRDEELINNILKRNNKINMFDMYRMDIIKKYKKE